MGRKMKSRASCAVVKFPKMKDVEIMYQNGKGVGYVPIFSEGVGRVRRLVVSDALPGDHVRVEVLHEGPQQIVGRLQEVLIAGPQRVAAPCPVASSCGGCQLQV
jgi:tRNA/tmRNA/rRNA uracil-C5-methylase (TrmA/RlmC/RlmD family)